MKTKSKSIRTGGARSTATQNENLHGAGHPLDCICAYCEADRAYTRLRAAAAKRLQTPPSPLGGEGRGEVAASPKIPNHLKSLIPNQQSSWISVQHQLPTLHNGCVLVRSRLGYHYIATRRGLAWFEHDGDSLAAVQITHWMPLPPPPPATPSLSAGGRGPGRGVSK